MVVNIKQTMASLYQKLMGKKFHKPLDVVAEATNVVVLQDQIASATDELSLATEDFDRDWIIINAESEVPKEIPLQKKGAIEAERLAKVSAYKLAVPCLENPDSADAAKQHLRTSGYELELLGSEDLRSKNGIYLYAMIKSDSSEPINIVCRGTAGDASVVADLDPNGPGYGAMKINRDLLIKQIDELARKYPSRKIRVTGHSLGGALAQVLTTNILEERVRACIDITNCAYPNLKKITCLETVLFQSASVNNLVAQDASKWANHMKMLDPNFEINLLAHIKQGDFVSRTGNYIFSDIDPEIAGVYLDLRALDKPWVTMKDALDVGFVAFTTGGSPIPMAICAASAISSRYVSNRLAAHQDFFYHDADDRTFSTLLPLVDHDYLSNISSEDRMRISHIFTKNDLQRVPMHQPIAKVVYDATQHLDNADVKAVATCISSALIAAPKVCEVVASSSRGSASGIMSAAKHLSEISLFASNITEHGPQVASAVQKIWAQIF